MFYRETSNTNRRVIRVSIRCKKFSKKHRESRIWTKCLYNTSSYTFQWDFLLNNMDLSLNSQVKWSVFIIIHQSNWNSITECVILSWRYYICSVAGGFIWWTFIWRWTERFTLITTTIQDRRITSTSDTRYGKTSISHESQIHLTSLCTLLVQRKYNIRQLKVLTTNDRSGR